MQKKTLAARLGAWIVSLCLVVTLIPTLSTPVYAEEVSFTITVGDVSEYEEMYGSKGFIQWYAPSDEGGYPWDSYLKKQAVSTSTGGYGWTSLEDRASVTSKWGDYMSETYYHGIRAQAPAEGYVLDHWKITDTTGKEVTDNFYFYMTKTYSTTDANGTRQYLLGLATQNYYGINLPADNTFVVTPIFVRGSAEGDIDAVNITMEERDYVGGDDYNALEERATIAAEDAEKYSITKEQTSREANVTGYFSGDYIVEPGDTLYYTAAFEANSGYQFANSVDLFVNGTKVATAESDGVNVRFQDAVQQTAGGGVTDVTFNENVAGKSTFSATVDYFGISRSKENIEAEKTTEYGMDTMPCTIICFEVSVNAGPSSTVYFEPKTSSGTETFVETDHMTGASDWDYTFAAGDEVSWKCYAYNFLKDDRMGWEPHLVGDVQEGSFTVKEAMPSPTDLTWVENADGTANASWKGVDGATEYYVELYRNGKWWGTTCFDNFSPVPDTAGTVHEENFNLPHWMSNWGGGVYTFRVTARNGDTGAWSDRSEHSKDHKYKIITTVDIGNVWDGNESRGCPIDPINKIPFTTEVHDERDEDGIKFNDKMTIDKELGADEAWVADSVINRNDGSGVPKVGKTYHYEVTLKTKSGWAFDTTATPGAKVLPFKLIVGGTEVNLSKHNVTAKVSEDGDSVTLVFKSAPIAPVTVKAVNISKATVTGIVNKTYNGSAQTQSPTIKMNVNGTAVTLKNGTDYTVSYKNNTNAGTATMTITGKGKFTGSVSKTFKINPVSIAKATVTGINASYTETGKAIAPAPTVKLAVGGKTVTLKKDTDYTVKYASNVKPGTATVTITGKGNYTGTVKKTFKITAKAQPELKIDSITAAKHEIGKVTFTWSKKSGTTGNWTIRYRWRKIGGNNSWTKWTTKTFKAGTMTTIINVPRNYCIEIQGKGSGDSDWCKSIFTTPAGGAYQSMKYVHVKNVSANKRITSLTLKKGQTVKLRPDYDYPVKDYVKRPRLYPNHMFYDDANTSIISIRNDRLGKAYDGVMVDGTVTIKGLKAGTTTITCRSPNGRTMKLKVTVK